MTSKISNSATVSQKQKSTKPKDNDGSTAISKNKSVSVRSASAKKRMHAETKLARIDSVVSCSCSVFVIVVSMVSILVLLLMDQFFDDTPAVDAAARRLFSSSRINYSREFKFRPTLNAATLAVRNDTQFPGFVFTDMNQFCQNLFGRCSFFDGKFVDNCSSTFCHAAFIQTSLENKTGDRFVYPPYLRIKSDVQIERLGRGLGLRAPDFAPCAGAKQKTIAGYCEAGSCIVGGPLLRRLQNLPRYDQMANKWKAGYSFVTDLSRSCVGTADRVDFETLFHPSKFGCIIESCDMTQLRIVAKVCDNPYPFLGAAHCSRPIGKSPNFPFTIEINQDEAVKYSIHINPFKSVICKDGFCKENIPTTYSLCYLEPLEYGYSPYWGLTIGGFCVINQNFKYVNDRLQQKSRIRKFL
uniref:Uncharacterized protein n=1 Tax=Romanomermis culicivorax TaxID=13658 RepID=A0A915J8F3_ROMCU